MPTVLRVHGYRFHFYAADRIEPAHVHVERESNTAKFWLEPVRLADNRGFGNVELRQIERIIEDHITTLTEAWNGYFPGSH